jgi:ATP-dependent Clp protease protease subunit
MNDREKFFSDVPNIEDHHYLLFNKEFDSESTGEAIQFIIARNLMTKNRPKFMRMIINSPGGEVAGAFALIDTMKGSKIPVYTYGLGEIASCGLMTFIAGEKGKRYITRNTAIMSHQYSWFSSGKHNELMATVKEFENTHQRILEHYKRCTGLTETQIKKYLLPAQDVWLTAQEAVKFGIADEIVDFY